jgi:hypothetical protein
MDIRNSVIAFSLLLTGCIPLKQDHFSDGRDYESFRFEEGYGLLQIGAPNSRKNVTLLAVQSYAIAPNGDRLMIKTEEHGYDIQQGFPYVRDNIYVIGRDGSYLKHLDDGKWRFVFHLEHFK